MAKTLMLTTNDDRAWELLGDDSLNYNDNGGAPDGNTWLPLEDVAEENAERVIAAGLGEWVNVSRFDDEEMHAYLGIVDYTNPTEEDVDTPEIRRDIAEGYGYKLDERGAEWAHYGAYGASDSLWLVVSKSRIGMDS